MISLSPSSFHLSLLLIPPLPPPDLPPVSVFFVSLPNQSFSFRRELISAVSYRRRNPPILSRALTPQVQSCSFSSSSISFSIFSRSAFHCDSLQMGLLCSVLLLGNLRRGVEQCLDWMWLALLSILCCRIGAVHKISHWQPAVYYHHGTDVQYCEHGLPINQGWL